MGDMFPNNVTYRIKENSIFDEFISNKQHMIQGYCFHTAGKAELHRPILLDKTIFHYRLVGTLL